MFNFRSAAAFLAATCLTASAFAVPEGWTEDFAAAQQQAAAEGKDLLLEFTGSDWCPPCKALKREVFDQSAFSETAPEKYVLVKLDFPNNVPQSEEVVAQNQALQQAYGIQGYPTVILADAEGRPYAQTGYQPGGADSYVKHLDQLQSAKDQRDESLAAAAAAEGAEKARALDDALSTVPANFLASYYQAELEQIVSLDADDAAGLKSKYEKILSAGAVESQMQEAFGLLSQEKFPEGLAKLSEILGNDNLDAEQKQVILAITGQVYAEMGEMQKAVDALNQAVAALPESQVVPQIKALLTQLESVPAK